MDQQPDTSSPADSSRKGRFWLENDADPPESARPRRSSAEEFDAPPTLFELPDRTPETLLRQAQGGHYEIHDSHLGPPASHVDPPSGNHSYLSAPVPQSPSDPESVLPDHADDAMSPNPELPLGSESANAAPKLAAFDGSPLTWATTGNLAWVAKPAAISLIVFLIPAAFLAGRALDRDGAPSKSSADSTESIAVSIESSEASMQSMVLMPDDMNFGADFSAELAAAENPDTAVAALSSADGSAVRNASVQPASIPAAQPAAVTDMAVHQPPNTTPLHGPPPTAMHPSPSHSQPSPGAIAGALGTPNLPPPGQPQFDGPNVGGTPHAMQAEKATAGTTAQDAMVAYRSDSQPSPSPSIANGVEAVPAGMGDRLRLEDGLRYTETPHPIGNFLDILKTWETSEPR